MGSIPAARPAGNLATKAHKARIAIARIGLRGLSFEIPKGTAFFELELVLLGPKAEDASR